MMEKLGQAKTHLELKKMIAEVDTNNSGEPRTPVHPLPPLRDAHDYIRISVMHSPCSQALHPCTYDL